MKIRILFSSLIFCLVIAVTEGNCQRSVNAAGGNGSGRGGSISYSVGQVVYVPMQSPRYTFSPGVQQPRITIRQMVENSDVVASVNASVHPNPTASSIYLTIENREIGNLSATLFSMQSVQLQRVTVLSSETQIEMDKYAPGIYILHVYDGKLLISSFKIIKN